MSKKKKKVQPQKVRVNFGNRTRYRPEKDDVPVHDRGHSSKPFRPIGLDDYSDLNWEDPIEHEDFSGD